MASKHLHVAKKLSMMREELERTKKQLETEAASRKILDRKFDFLRITIGQLSEAIMVTSPEGKIEFVNPAFERITGFKKSEVVGSKPSLLKSGVHKEDYYRELWATIKAGKSWKGTMTNRGKDGSLFTEDVLIVPIPGADGSPGNFVKISTLIPQVAAPQAEKAPSAGEGDDSAGRMKSLELVAGSIAREFDDRLRLVRENTGHIIKYLKPDDPIFAYWDRVERLIDDILKFNNKLLAFSGQVQLTPGIICLNSVITSIEDSLKRKVGQDVEISIRLKQGLPKIFMDHKQLEFLVSSLVSGWKKALQKGGKIKIETGTRTLEEDFCQSRAQLKPGEFVVLSIKGNANGINGNGLADIFEPFSQSGEIRSESGLSLAAAYGIAKKSGACIEAAKEDGGDVIVRVYFPVVDDKTILDVPRTQDARHGQHPEDKTVFDPSARHPHQAPPAHSPPEPITEPFIAKPQKPASPAGSEPAPPASSGLKILCVDDESTIREIVQEVLTRAGYEVSVAASGEEALALFKRNENAYEILVTDVIMPGIDGIMLSRQLKILKPGLKVLLMSGYISDMAVDGIEGIITKPFRSHALIEKVKEIYAM
jgi:PAS domain S-box-containing protein